MSFLKNAGIALLSGWIIGVAFGWLKLPATVPSLMGLIGASGVLIGGYCYSLLIRIFSNS
jgi:xanthosine utilization system XapX-like protein